MPICHRVLIWKDHDKNLCRGFKHPIFEMMSPIPKPAPQWIEHFGLSQSEAQAMIEGLQKGECFVRRLFEAGKVTQKAWERWAPGHFCLPVLQRTFQPSPHQQQLQERYRGIFPNSLVVLEDWDGILFLGCLAPLEDFQSPQKFQWVLVSYDQLLQLRGEPAADHSQVPPAIDDGMPQGLDLQSAANVGSNDEPLLQPLETDIPAGLVDTSILKANIQADHPSAADSLEKTAAFSLDFGSLSLEHDDSPSVVSAATNVSSPAASPHTQPMPGSQPPPIEVEHAASPPPIPNIPQPPPIPGRVVTPPPVPASSAPVRMTAPPLGGKPPIDATVSTSETERIVTEMQKHFERAMLLLFHNSELKVWHASQGWQQDKSRGTQVDLSGPSVFRIVKETKLPYHGYMVGNQINDAFFQTWAKGELPEHLTIVPVLYEKNLIGMLLGATSKERGMKIAIDSIQGLGLEAGLSLVSQAAA